MATLPFWGSFVAALIALIPAFFTGWEGRVMVRMVEDAAIAERFLAHRWRILLITITAAAVLIVSLPKTLIWSIPLLILSRAIAVFPIRRALFGETWNLAEYLIHGFRLYVALLGFWILLAACPFLARGNRWWISILLSAILFLWDRHYAKTVLRLIGAKPLTSEALSPHFKRVTERSRLPAPSIWCAGPAGATFANALALPSWKQPSVLISRTLLDRLNEVETAAIFAHEIAHLEQYNRARLWREQFAILGLIITATFLIPFVQGWAPQTAVWMSVAWPVLVFLFLAFRARHSQANEQASDLRAVELCDDADALINALVKLHAIGRLPRRWDIQMEASASHPSLAHRIRTIRDVAPSPPGQSGCEIFRAPGSGVFVALDETGIRHFWSVPPGCAATVEALEAAAGGFTSLRFSQLAELRVSAKGNSDPELICTDKKGERRTLRIRAEDLPRLQRTLDRVDVLLAPVPKGPFAGRQVASIAASIAALAALIGAQLWSVTFVALAAAFRPTIRLLATAAVVSILSLVLIVTRATPDSEHRFMTLIPGILPLVAAAFWTCYRSRDESFVAMEKIPQWILWVLGIAAIACYSVPFLVAQGSLLTLSRFSKATAAPVVLPFAMALLLIHGKKRRLRGLAALFGIAGCTSIILGTQWFREQIIRDPLSSAIPEFRVSNASAKQISQFRVKPWPSDLRLAPEGTRLAIRYGDSEDEEGPYSYEVYGKSGVHLGTVEQAVDLQFTDESHMLVLNAAPSALVLDLVGVDKSSLSVWRSRPGVNSGRLAVEPDTGEWRILSRTREGKLIRFQGTLGKDRVTTTEWAPPAPDDGWANHGISGSGSISVWVHQRWNVNEFMRIASVFASFSGEYPVESSLFIARQSHASLVTRSGTQLTCLDPPVGNDQFICFASYDGTTNVFALDPSDEAAHGLGAFRGRAWAGEVGNSGTVILAWNGSPALLHLRKRHLFRIPSLEDIAAIGGAARGPIIGVLSTDREQSMATVYGVDDLVR